jgi:putative endonuclease
LSTTSLFAPFVAESFAVQVQLIAKFPQKEVVSRGTLVKWDIIMYMFYTYILKSKVDESYYIGFTEDLKNRLKIHNQKRSRYSSSRAPFEIAWYAAFTDKKKSVEFEKYLKSSSGFAFRNKRLL